MTQIERARLGACGHDRQTATREGPTAWSKNRNIRNRTGKDERNGESAAVRNKPQRQLDQEFHRLWNRERDPHGRTGRRSKAAEIIVIFAMTYNLDV